VSAALEFGQRAGESIQAHWQGDDAALTDYAKSVDQSFEGYLQARGRYYGREQRWAQSVFWRRRHTKQHGFQPRQIRAANKKGEYFDESNQTR
jgi:hypothetical protein